ncbi:hypothetical protein [Curtobacterium sp. MCSS17_016]|uniref:hypothetical protein n=1 Tax=Curtobacterium sp. MCSS17_016 TaxID=2175644 RepID=UPI000DAA98ED|nr:hypothetical protein [Curtobacterium sp. MCSS17_016]WIE81140.1 hypothetical protein DEJ19_021935 [Curtobacterium sp. MCSS17_016]
MSNPTRLKDVQGAGQVDPTTGKKVSGGQYYFGREAGAAEVSLTGANTTGVPTQDDLDTLGEKLGGMHLPAGAYSNNAVTTMTAFADKYPRLADGAASAEEEDGVVSIDVFDGVVRFRVDAAGELRHADYDDSDEELALRRAMLTERHPHSTYRPYDRLTVDDFEALEEYQRAFGDDMRVSGNDSIRTNGAGRGQLELTTKAAGKDVLVTDAKFKDYLWERVQDGRIKFPLEAENRWVQYDGSPEAQQAFGQYVDALHQHPELIDGMGGLSVKGTLTANGKTVHVIHDAKWWA